jgi:hypothetical protein
MKTARHTQTRCDLATTGPPCIAELACLRRGETSRALVEDIQPCRNLGENDILCIV